MPKAYVYIYLDGIAVPAGLLETRGEGRYAASEFTYGNRYLERQDRIALDPVQLPLMAGRQFTPEHFALFGGIRDAAPDRWGRHLMERAAGAQVLTEFDYLVASGDWRVGALAFGSDLTGPQRMLAWRDEAVVYGEDLDLEALLAALPEFDTAEDLPANVRRFFIRGSSLGGARPKVTILAEGRPWIAKFGRQTDRYPVCRFEYVAMRLAGEVGLRVPRTRLERVLGQDVYLIERFDRPEGTFGESRTPFLSGLTLLGAHESESSRYSYRNLAEQIRRFGSKPAIDMKELWMRMIFNILCSNNDDHLRNHGFLWDGTGWRLSPAYDIVATPQANHQRDLALGVGREGRSATLRNALTEIASFGLSLGEAHSLAEKMQAEVRTEWERVGRQSGLTGSEMERMRMCFLATEEKLPVIS